MKNVYLDNNSTTPVLPEVRDAMLPFLGENFGNPSCLHDWGEAPREALETAREQVGDLISAPPEEIIFTGSGTESNNFAVKGIAWANQKKGKHIVVSAVEHFSVLNSVKTLEKMGFTYTVVPVDNNAVIDPEKVRQAIREDTILVSVMHANSEVGSIEPIKEIAKLTQEKGVIFHTDAVATAGVIPVDVKELGVDALSLAGNMFYGPKGAAALWLRKGIRIMPLLDGGVQEGGRRAGTENVAGIVGLGKAAELAKAQMLQRNEYLTKLRNRLIKELPAKIDHVVVTGHPQNRLPGHASFCVEFIEGESMLMMLSMKGVAVTSGSACTSRSLLASHVLLAMGLSHEIAQGSLLFGLGLDNKEEDIDYVLTELPPIVERLRQMSPLYSKYLKSKGG
ncbi:MAG TPA: cysteine desulfurase family protein [Dehalococcoidales bacterium]|nr:cysteine desulfurase family protein [Dehalococcoidales bacterium]